MLMNWKRVILLIAVLALVVVGGGMALSATYSDFTSGNKAIAKSGIEPVHNYLPFIDYRKFDFGSAALNGGSGVTNGDVIKLFNVPANTYIDGFGIRVTTAAVASGTSCEVGDGADTDGYVDNANLNGVGFINLSEAQTGVSMWNYIGINSSSAVSSFIIGGVKAVGSAYTGSYTLTTNHGAYFTALSGLSPYIGPDTIDMVIHVDNQFAPGTGKSGVTPVFEAYIKGFKRVVP
jgi:hypothetical protein